MLGLIISTAGALLASSKSLCDNLKMGDKKEKEDSFKPIMTEMQSKKIEVED